MRRRQFIIGLGLGTALRPFAADAQQSGRPVVGFLRSTPAQPFESLVTAFVGGLKDGGFVAGQTVEVEYRYADNQLKRLPDLAADLIGRKAAVIVTNGVAALAIKATVTAVPIVFTDGGDPVQQGLVSNIARPGGNITGVTFFSGALGPKRLELLRALVPDTALYAMLVGPHSIETEIDRTAVQEAVQAIGRRLVVADAANDTDIDAAFAMFAQLGAGALLVGPGAFLTSKRERVLTLAAHEKLPAIHTQTEAAQAGGLMSYSASQSEAYRIAGLYTARILHGEKQGDLPVVRSSKFELVINLKTAKTLGLSVPPSLLALADEVIE